MENEIGAKRGLVLILIIATVVIFVGFVWIIATYLPRNKLGFESPSATVSTRVELNCTYPISYWKDHPELYPSQIVIGGQVYMEKDLEVILSNGTQNPAQQLQAQLVGAFLNISSGADQSSIETTIFKAYGWLVQHPAGSQVTDGEFEDGSRLYNVLEAYNMGLTGVEPCEMTSSNTLTATSTATVTPTVLMTLTPSQTFTPTASETPTPIVFTATATYIYIQPSRTATRTTEPPHQNPTKTPVPPTETPAPTNTLPPPTYTPAPTLPPPPTPTPTLPGP